MHSLSWPRVAHYELVCRIVVNSLVFLLVSEFTVVLSGLSFGGVDWCLVCLGVLRVVCVCVCPKSSLPRSAPYGVVGGCTSASRA